MSKRFEDIPEPLHPFVDHGVEFSSQSREQWSGTAPFSEKDGHFYVNPTNGKWDEKQRGEHGNRWTFLGKMAEFYRENYTADRQGTLAKRFGLPLDAVQLDDIGYDPISNAYTFAIRNEKGTVLDIRRRRLNGKPMSTKGCKVRLWGMDKLAKAKPGSRVYIVEGESDRMAMSWLLDKNTRKQNVVVSVPGAGVFKDEWAKQFTGKEVITLFDKDDAGRSGTQRVHAKLRAVGVVAKCFCHDEDWSEGLDMRDFIVHARRKGIPLAECFAAIEQRLHPLDLDDNDRPTRQRLIFQTADEVMSTEPPGFVVDGVIPQSGVSVIVGQPGNGKSFLTLDLAVAVASGTPWHGREVETGYVLIVSAEGLGGQGPRIDAAISSLPPEKQRLALSRMLFTGDAPAIHKPEDPNIIIERGRELEEPPRIVVLDTLARCMPGGDENAAQDMGSFIAGVDRIREALGCAVVVLHHTVKDGSTERGSSALRGACDVMLFCKLKDGGLTVNFEKCRDYALPSPMHFAFKEHAKSVRLVPVDPAAVIAAGAERLRSSMVFRALEGHGWMHLEAICSNARVSDRTARRALADLVEAGEVDRRQEGRNVQWRVIEKPTPKQLRSTAVDRDQEPSRPRRSTGLGRDEPPNPLRGVRTSASRSTRPSCGQQPRHPSRSSPPGAFRPRVDRKP